MYSAADMKSCHSDSLILIWRIAELEARHQNASTIEPTHLLLGLCKVVDVDLPETVSKDLPNRDEVLEELLREVRRIRTVFHAARLDAKTFRRRLRLAPPERRFTLMESPRLRRSPASKQVFADAEHLAELGNGTVYPAHLLYATLLGKDEHRDMALAATGVEKKRLLTVAKREVLRLRLDSASSSSSARRNWN